MPKFIISLIVGLFLLMTTTACQQTVNDERESERLVQRIAELEEQLSQLQKQYDNQLIENELLADKVTSLIDQSSANESLLMNIALLGKSTNKNSGGMMKVPVHYAAALANHLSLLSYTYMTVDEVEAITNNLALYQDIQKIDHPFLYIQLHQPLMISIQTTDGKLSVETDEILLQIIDKKQPQLLIKSKDKYIGFSMLMLESTKYDYDILYRHFIDHDEEITELFRDW